MYNIKIWEEIPYFDGYILSVKPPATFPPDKTTKLK